MDRRIKDIMTREIKSLSPDANAKEALKMLIDLDMSGLPVIDKDGNIVGVFTEKEILQSVLPVYIKDVGTFVYSGDSKPELKRLAGLEKLSVKDLMRKEVPTVPEDAILSEASRIMLTKSERRVIVIGNKDKKAVGIITRYDVIRALAKEVGIARQIKLKD